MLARKEREFNDSLAKSRGVIVDALSNTEIVTPGESVDVTTNVFIGRPSPGEKRIERRVAEDSTRRPRRLAGRTGSGRRGAAHGRPGVHSRTREGRCCLSFPRHGPRKRTTGTTVLVSQTARERSIRLGLFDAAQSAVRARARSREGRA